MFCYPIPIIGGSTRPRVGAGLLANAVCHYLSRVPVHRGFASKPAPTDRGVSATFLVQTYRVRQQAGPYRSRSVQTSHSTITRPSIALILAASSTLAETTASLASTGLRP